LDDHIYPSCRGSSTSEANDVDVGPSENDRDTRIYAKRDDEQGYVPGYQNISDGYQNDDPTMAIAERLIARGPRTW